MKALLHLSPGVQSKSIKTKLNVSKFFVLTKFSLAPISKLFKFNKKNKYQIEIQLNFI